MPTTTTPVNRHRAPLPAYSGPPRGIQVNLNPNAATRSWDFCIQGRGVSLTEEQAAALIRLWQPEAEVASHASPSPSIGQRQPDALAARRQISEATRRKLRAAAKKRQQAQRRTMAAGASS